MRTYTWKKLELAILLGLSVTLLWGAVSLHRQETLSRKMIRLHVIANSDSDADQALKLRVRDAVLTRATELLTQSGDMADAWVRLDTSLPDLERAASAACTDMEQVAIDAGLSGDDVKLITEEDGYVLRFRAVELWQRLRQWLGK